VLRYLLLWKRRSPNIGLCEIGSAEHRAARNSGISDEAGRSRRAKGLGSANCLTRNSKLLPTARIGAHRGRVRGALPPLPTPTKPTISHSIVRMRQFNCPALRDTLSHLPIDVDQRSSAEDRDPPSEISGRNGKSRTIYGFSTIFRQPQFSCDPSCKGTDGSPVLGLRRTHKIVLDIGRIVCTACQGSYQFAA
jgi:hypothetical protein